MSYVALIAPLKTASISGSTGVYLVGPCVNFSPLLWKCHIHVGYIGPIAVNYLTHRKWPPYFIHRNSAMTARSPWRNKHGVLTHHVPLRSHFFTLGSDTSISLLHTDTVSAQGVCWQGQVRINTEQEVNLGFQTIYCLSFRSMYCTWIFWFGLARNFSQI